MGTLAALARWGAVGGTGWLIGGLVFGAVIPFTLFVIFPTNKRLLDLDLTSSNTVILPKWMSRTRQAVRPNGDESRNSPADANVSPV